MTVLRDGNWDIWVYDLEREVSTRLTFDEASERKVLRRGGSYGRYVPSGHVVYVNQATLFAVPFDLGKLEVTGSPAPTGLRTTAPAKTSMLPLP